MDDAKDVGGLEAARAAKPKALKAFKKIGKVNGVGLTRQGDVYAVRINLQEDLAKDVDCPAEIDGVPVVVKVIGDVRKQADADD